MNIDLYHIVLILTLVLAAIVIVGAVKERKLRRLRKKLKRYHTDRLAMVNFMDSFSHSVSTSEDLETTVIGLGRYIAEAIHAQSLCLFFAGKDKNRLEAIATIGPFPCLATFDGAPPHEHCSIRDHVILLDDSPLGQITRNHKGILIQNPKDDIYLHRCHPAAGIRSIMAVPVVLYGEVLGLIVAVNSTSTDGVFDMNDLDLLESVAGHATLAHNMLQSFERIKNQERLTREVEFARDIQRTLMPAAHPDLPGIDIYAANLPAKEVSGDFYDYITIDEHRTLMVLADASGKGIPACMIMTMTRSVLRSLCSRFTSLEELLVELNKYLVEDTEMSRFVTMVFCLIDTSQNTMEMARAGHTDIFIRNRHNQVFRIVPEGPAIGLIPDDMGVTFETFSLSCSEAYSILFYSDGLTEAINAAGTEYGPERLIESWRRQSGPASACVNGILADLRAFTQDEEQADDQTVMLIRVVLTEKS